MPPGLFGEYVQATRASTIRTRIWSYVPISIVAHLVAAIVLLIAPLAAEVELPSPAPLHAVEYMEVKPIPPPPAVVRVAAGSPPPRTEQASSVPTEAPSEIRPEREQPAAAAGELVEGAIPLGSGADVSSFGGNATSLPPPPPPPPPEKPAGPLRVGQGIREPARVVYVQPVYPAIARAAHVEGTVVLEAILRRDGQVDSVRVLHSVPLLDAAATDAVRQWRYTPTLLNGEPVEVLMTISVRFTLQ